MAVEITDYVDVPDRMSQLGCAVRDEITLLPANFESAASAAEFVTAGTAPTIIKVLRQGGLHASVLQAGESGPGFIHNKSHDWVVPAIYISAELLKTTPDLISVAIDLIRDYAITLYRGVADRKVIKAEFVVEQSEGHTYKRLSYEGDVEGMREIAQIARDICGTDQGQ